MNPNRYGGVNNAHDDDEEEEEEDADNAAEAARDSGVPATSALPILLMEEIIFQIKQSSQIYNCSIMSITARLIDCR
jgi:hypothetical protein